MVAYIFNSLLDEGLQAGKAPGLTLESRDWFRSLARNTVTASPAKITRTAPKAQIVRRPDLGFMYHFFYDPKTKAKLPYYDRFPLIFRISPDIQKGSFLGINLHYLNPRLRARLMDQLYTVSTDKRFDEKTRLRINYNILNRASKFRFFRPCVKRYLLSNVRSRFVKINSDTWDLALFLPTERFIKANKTKVFRDSREAVGR